MSPDEVKSAIDAAIGGRVILSYGQMVILALIAGVLSFIGGYVSKKGQNFATKEDIAGITQATEQIKLEIAARSAFYQKLTTDQYEMAHSLEATILHCAAQINGLRLGARELDEGFIVGNDVVQLTELCNKITLHKQLLGDELSNILKDQSDLLIEMLNDRGLDRQEEHAKRYGELSGQFHKKMNEMFFDKSGLTN